MTEQRVVVTGGFGIDTRSYLTVYRYNKGTQGSPLDQIQYETRFTRLTKPDGTVVFDNTEDGGFRIPTSWSILAGDIAAEKYARKAGCTKLSGERESSVRHIIYRVSEKIRQVGMETGYFLTEANSYNFQHELEDICVNQYGAFNSPVWFNCGLDLYGCVGSGGNWRWAVEGRTVYGRGDHGENLQSAPCSVQTENAYYYPQCSACFILTREDDLDSIYQGVKDEARLFKYGSGAGSNYSRIRSKYEKLSGGGTSSGVMSFLRVYDVAAGSLKSGGTTRRAAKMDVLNDDHPEVLNFIRWKSGEEKKARVLMEAGYPGDTMESEAYMTVSGQNSNNSVRISDDFMRCLDAGGRVTEEMRTQVGVGLWSTRLVTTGAIHRTFPAADLWRAIAVCTWECGDPGVHFGGTINEWHTCPVSGPINASNPCSEYLFLDDTACNLASLNLLKYVKTRVTSKGLHGVSEDVSETYFDTELFQHHVRILFIAQEILVGASSYPTAKVAENSFKFRPLGLGHCNGGLMLMTLGIPYDSDEGRALMGAITSLMTATAYHTSTMLAQVKGPFEGYEANKVPFMAVMEKHRQASSELEDRINGTFGNTTHRLLNPISTTARRTWGEVVGEGERHGFRNAQATVLAPTGTIGFLMGAETTGVEPLYSIVMTKKYAGGSSRKIVCDGALTAIRAILAQEAGSVSEYHASLVEAYVLEHGHVTGSHLPEKYWPIFATAGGQANVIPWKAHIDMMEAVQPFLSGAISKTVNMPEESSVEDIERAYLAAYQKGLKAVAIYRNNSKGNQPLNTTKEPITIDKVGFLQGMDMGVPGGDKTVLTVGEVYETPTGRWVQPLQVFGLNREMGMIEMGAVPDSTPDPAIQNQLYGVTLESVRQYALDYSPRYIKEMDQGTLDALEIPPFTEHLREFFAPLGITKPMIKVLGISTSAQGLMEHLLGIKPKEEAKAPTRHKMKDKAKCDIYRPMIGGQRFYIHVGLDDSGKPLEVFLRGLKMGGATLALLDAWCVAISCALQYGMPLSEVVDKFTFLKFEPAGGVQHHSSIKMCSSVIDLIARILGYEYLGMKDLGHVEEESTILASAFKETVAPSPALMEHDAAVQRAKETVKLSNPILNHDAPLCDVCGHITQPNGKCHRCPNCGHSMGCS